jgi:hypothetical protein
MGLSFGSGGPSQMQTTLSGFFLARALSAARASSISSSSQRAFVP